MLVILAAATVFVEAHHAIPRFRLLTFALVFLFLAVATSLAPERWRSGLLLVSALLFGLAVTEAVAAMIEPKSDLVVPASYLGEAPVVGWRFGPAGVYHVRRTDPRTGTPIYDVDYTIDKDHDRLTKSADAGRAVVFFGDSFTFGDGVSDAETMPQRFADLFDGKQKAVNLGVSGYSPAQVLRELQTGYKDAAIGHDPLAFVMLTGPFHAMRTACKEPYTIPAPRFDEDGGRVTYQGACAQGARRMLREFLQNTASYRVFVEPLVTRLTRRDVALYIDIVARTVAAAKAKFGVETIVPFVGAPDYLKGTGYDDASVLAALRARGIKAVDMTLLGEEAKGRPIAIPGDGHPTPYAHALRAKLIFEQLKSLGVELPSQTKEANQRP